MVVKTLLSEQSCGNLLIGIENGDSFRGQIRSFFAEEVRLRLLLRRGLHPAEMHRGRGLSQSGPAFARPPEAFVPGYQNR